jgi:tRNA(Ile)-lysidine synthase
MLDQLRGARGDSMVRLAHAGVEIGVHKGRIALHRAEPMRFDVPWCGEPLLALPHGTLVFGQAEGVGVNRKLLTATNVRVRSRAGGERFQIAPDRPRRALKAVLRETGIPAWDRNGLPLIFCGDALAAVAGVGVDAAFRTEPAQPGVTIAWLPKAR